MVVAVVVGETCSRLLWSCVPLDIPWQSVQSSHNGNTESWTSHRFGLGCYGKFDLTKHLSFTMKSLIDLKFLMCRYIYITL